MLNGTSSAFNVFICMTHSGLDDQSQLLAVVPNLDKINAAGGGFTKKCKFVKNLILGFKLNQRWGDRFDTKIIFFVSFTPAICLRSRILQ